MSASLSYDISKLSRSADLLTSIVAAEISFLIVVEVGIFLRVELPATYINKIKVRFQAFYSSSQTGLSEPCLI